MASCSVNKKTITARHEELFAMPSISSQLPVVFDNECSWAEFDGYCSECGNKIDDSMIRGSVNKPFAHVAVIDAVGICKPCRVLTVFYNRLYDDMRITAIKDGKWCTWKAEPSVTDRLKGWITRMLQSIWN